MKYVYSLDLMVEYSRHVACRNTLYSSKKKAMAELEKVVA
jgi:hypothetical protein